MRETILDQLPLTPAPINHEHARELLAASALLDRNLGLTELVARDLSRRKDGQVVNARVGRRGVSAEQILRAAFVKMLNGFSYEQLAFHLADSSCYRSFCRLPLGGTPTRSTLQKNIKKLRPQTWKAINEAVVGEAVELGIESGKKIRVDCTVVESNIHHPTDSQLLVDGIRVLVLRMKRLRSVVTCGFRNHLRRAKRRATEIRNARGLEQKRGPYKDLLKMGELTVGYAECFADQLRENGAESFELQEVIKLVNQVISQTERRVLRGESVPAEEKVVSLFEPHTDIIVKDYRDTLYGHKICLASGSSGLITDVETLKGNPSDRTLAQTMAQRHREHLGNVPKQMAFDGGFASKENLEELKKLGVQDVVFHKRVGLAISDMAKSTWIYKKLRAFRAGIEGNISLLKRVFGLSRCNWRSFDSFASYVQAAVFACNLSIVARHLASA